MIFGGKTIDFINELGCKPVLFHKTICSFFETHLFIIPEGYDEVGGEDSKVALGGRSGGCHREGNKITVKETVMYFNRETDNLVN